MENGLRYSWIISTVDSSVSHWPNFINRHRNAVSSCLCSADYCLHTIVVKGHLSWSFYFLYVLVIVNLHIINYILVSISSEL